MAIFSSSFRRFIRHFLFIGAAVALAFALGVWGYFLLAPRLHPATASVTNFSGTLQQAATHDLQAAVDDVSVTIPKSEIASWLESYTRTYTGQTDMRISDRLETYVATLADKVDRDPVDARFTFDGSKVTIISPARLGRTLDVSASSDAIRRALYANASKVTLVVQPVNPVITEQTIAQLGITDHLATGESNFAGSSASRVQNIKVSSQRYNGHIIKPGETFSFNDILGPVDADNGYAPEKVIKDNKLEYEYGGGICQVSTTLFRAAIYAGLPINERRNHSFPVAYYNPQGFDATIYPGVSDLKFTNDTPGNILIQTHISGTKIYFDLYGTSDGRKVAVDGPYQYDIQPDGSMKASFTRTIAYSDGTSVSRIFNSNYKSPNAYPLEKNPYE
ncbi:MAG TPA: VanW family protein [Candidatus Paceibacterota bacterium]|nr:VanW family protein [Candidatus Paceibacterota bacterium]